MTSLNHVCLNDNPIVQIDPDAFRGLLRLKRIELFKNQLYNTNRKIFLFLEKNIDYVSIRNQHNDLDIIINKV